jgi:hypothetical protein
MSTTETAPVTTTMNQSETNLVIFRNFPTILNAFIQGLIRYFPRSRFVQDFETDPNEYHWWIFVHDDHANIERKIYGYLTNNEIHHIDGTITRTLQIHTEFRHISVQNEQNEQNELVYYDEMWYNNVNYLRIYEIIHEYRQFLQYVDIADLTQNTAEITI